MHETRGFLKPDKRTNARACQRQRTSTVALAYVKRIESWSNAFLRNLFFFPGVRYNLIWIHECVATFRFMPGISSRIRFAANYRLHPTCGAWPIEREAVKTWRVPYTVRSACELRKREWRASRDLRFLLFISPSPGPYRQSSSSFWSEGGSSTIFSGLLIFSIQELMQNSNVFRV